jgi:hypothetical protein
MTRLVGPLDRLEAASARDAEWELAVKGTAVDNDSLRTGPRLRHKLDITWPVDPASRISAPRASGDRGTAKIRPKPATAGPGSGSW